MRDCYQNDSLGALHCLILVSPQANQPDLEKEKVHWEKCSSDYFETSCIFQWTVQPGNDTYNFISSLELEPYIKDYATGQANLLSALDT